MGQRYPCSIRTMPKQRWSSDGPNSSPNPKGGAAMFKQYAKDAQQQGRAVHVSHEQEAGPGLGLGVYC